jgi:4-alpha-glucanotransferase
VAQRPVLHALADRYGILPSYLDIDGVRRWTSDETRVAILAAMGIEASSETAAASEIEAIESRSSRRSIPPVIVQRWSRSRAGRLRCRPPDSLHGTSLDYRLELLLESGESHVAEGTTRLPRNREYAGLSLPVQPGPGYHRLQLRIASGQDSLDDDSSLIVCPDSCLTAGEILDDQRRFGIWTHLYSVRGARDWGIGDMGVLRSLVGWAEDIGATFVGLNPLHALHNRDTAISPYSPVSRLYRNVIYIDVEQVPELSESAEAQSLIASPDFRRKLAELRQRRLVDYDGVMALKRPVLQALHRTFVDSHVQRNTERARAYNEFLESRGQSLTNFATFVALSEHLRSQHGADWRCWPEAYRSPDSAEVERFRQRHAESIDRQRYLQFELDRQIRELAHTSGLAIGLYGDLAIGTAPSGSDPWMFPGLFLNGASVGAPPDDYSLNGQDWGLPPIDPIRLRTEAYRYWILLLRNALQHMGALRIDHVMGLFRQYWIPAGRPATEGAYVRFPSNDLLGILALESRRHGSLIIGEDLGTVPRGLPALLHRWGILSSRVLYFEKDGRGRYRSPRRYSRRALVTANTHDHPPLAGFWEGRDLQLRDRAGSLGEGRTLSDAMGERQDERRALIARLEREGCLHTPISSSSYPQLCKGVYEMLTHTPAPLVGVWLDDLAGETDPVNLPGVELDRYPGWSRRLRRTIEELRKEASVTEALAGLTERVS